jgi:TonB family protein
MATVASPTAPSTAREQVVLVDHDLEALKALVAPLRGQFEFHLTISASEALALLDHRAITAVIAGQRLFSASGVELLTEARKRSPRTMRVLLADANERKAIAPGTDPNAFQVLNRPCTAEQLKELLEVAAWSSTVPVEETGEIENVVLETAQEEPRPVDTTGAPVTVLTTDADLYEAIRAAVQNRHETYLATRIEDAVALAAEGRCPVLVTDFALAQPALERIARQIALHEPALVTVVVGGREQGNALMGLLGTGVIHRFLLKPVTSGLARLAIESAARHHAGLLTQVPPAPALRPARRTEARQPPAPAPEAESDGIPVLQPLPAGKPSPSPVPKPSQQAAKPAPAPVVKPAPPAPVAKPTTPAPKPAPPPEAAPRPRFAPSPVLAQEREDTTFQLTAPLAAGVAEAAEEAIAVPPPDRFAPIRARPIAFFGGIAAIVAIVAAAAGWWWYQANRPPPTDPRQLAIQNNLTAALGAFDDGRLITPEGQNAFFYYSEILKSDPQNTAALEGLERIGEHYIEQAENLMVAGDLDGAAQALAAVRLVQPEHKRLRFLDTQLRKEQRDRLMVQAGESASAGNTRKAQELLQEAEKIAPEQSAQLGFAQQVIAQRERTQLAGRSLETARQRLTQNRLVNPPNDSAKFHLRAAQRADPANVAVQQSLRDLTTRVLAEANTAVEKRQFDSARTWLREAQDLGASAEQLAPIRTALEGAQVDRQKNDLLQLVLKRSEENRLLEPAQDSARHYLARLVQADARFPGIAQGVNTLGAKLVAAAQAATAQRQYDQAGQLLSEARAIGYTGAELAAAESALGVARTPVPTTPTLADVAPKRVRAVVPQYPPRALEDGTEGWVDVSFRVSAEGNVTDAKVEGAVPRNLFERPALAAVRQWKFEARENNAVYTKRIRTRVEFELKE